MKKKIFWLIPVLLFFAGCGGGGASSGGTSTSTGSVTGPPPPLPFTISKVKEYGGVLPQAMVWVDDAGSVYIDDEESPYTLTKDGAAITPPAISGAVSRSIYTVMDDTVFESGTYADGTIWFGYWTIKGTTVGVATPFAGLGGWLSQNGQFFAYRTQNGSVSVVNVTTGATVTDIGWPNYLSSMAGLIALSDDGTQAIVVDPSASGSQFYRAYLSSGGPQFTSLGRDNDVTSFDGVGNVYGVFQTASTSQAIELPDNASSIVALPVLHAQDTTMVSSAATTQTGTLLAGTWASASSGGGLIYFKANGSTTFYPYDLGAVSNLSGAEATGLSGVSFSHNGKYFVGLKGSAGLGALATPILVSVTPK